MSRGADNSSGRPFDYLWMVALLWISGNPLFGAKPVMQPLVAILAFLLLALMLAKRVVFSKRDLWIFGSFGIIIVIQVAGMESIGLLSVLGFFAKLMIAFAAVRLIRNFARVYVDVMFWTAMISFPFFALMIATQGRIADMIAPLSINVPDPYFLVHYFASGHSLQNNSYFWEPGVYAGYLLLALAYLGAIKEHYSFRRYRFIVFVLLAAVATTQSTGGYLVAPLAMIFHGKAIGKNMVFRAVLVLAATVGLIFLFTSADFLGNKIRDQNQGVQGKGRGWQLTRLGSMIYDFRLIRQRPLFGWGPDPDLQNGVVDRSVQVKEGNGLSNYTSHFGFFGMALFLAAAWIGFRNIFGGKGWLATLALIIAVVMLNDECFLSFPVYMSLMFLRGPTERSVGLSVGVGHAPDGQPPPAIPGPLNSAA
jgi:hypothetical protein